MFCCLLDSGRSFRAAKRDDDSDDDDVPAPSSGGYDPSVGGVVPKDKLALLDAQYTGATKAKSENENPHLLKYIDEKMGTGKKGGDSQGGQKAKSEFDKLYELPSHMKAVREKGQGEFFACSLLSTHTHAHAFECTQRNAFLLEQPTNGVLIRCSGSTTAIAFHFF